MHICSALPKFISHQHESLSTYPCYHMSILYLRIFKKNATSYFILNIYTSIYLLQLSNCNSSRLSPNNKKGQIGISSTYISNVCPSLITIKNPIISTSHLFSPLTIYSHSKSLPPFLAGHCLISPWWVEMTPQAQVLVAEPEKAVCWYVVTSTPARNGIDLPFTIKVYCWSAMRESFHTLSIPLHFSAPWMCTNTRSSDLRCHRSTKAST